MAPGAMAPRTLFATMFSGLMFVALFATLSTTLSAQVPFERLREAHMAGEADPEGRAEWQAGGAGR